MLLAPSRILVLASLLSAASMVCCQKKGLTNAPPALTPLEDPYKVESKSALVKWKDLGHNFGKVPFGSDVSHTFEFRNTSKTDVFITEVLPACGCTTADYTRDFIKPGATGRIITRYDSSRIGAFNKSVTVKINGEPVEIYIKGEINPPAKE